MKPNPKGDDILKKAAKRLFAFCFAICLILAQGSAVFAEDIMHNSLIENAYVLDTDSFTEYYVGYFIGSNDSDDWGVYLADEAAESGTLGRMYGGSAKVGNTLSAEIGCATAGARLGITFEAVDEGGNVLDSVTASNETSGADSVDCQITVPEGAVDVALLMVEYPVSGGYGSKGTVAVMAEFLVNGTASAVPAAPISDGPDNSGETPDDGGYEEPTKDWENPNDDDNNKSSSVVPIVIAGVAGAGLVVGGIFVAKGIAAGKAAADTVSAAASVPKEETYTLKDPATGAETLYIKDQTTGEWVSSDGSTVLDKDKVPEWKQQRSADRAWQDEANEGVKKPTRFEDIDAEQKRMDEQISRETYYEKVAIKHGMDAGDMDAVYEKVSADQARAEVSAQEWSDLADRADTGLKIAENLKTTADYSVSALGAVTGPAGTVVKDLYSAGTTIGGDVSEAIAEGKDGYEIAQTAAGAVTKTAVSVIQNHATGVAGKATADIAGGAVSGGTDAYVKGKDVGQGIATGAASGTLSAMADASGEMAGVLKDSGMADGLKKDLVSEAIDAGGDFIKSSADDAVSESFEKTFDDLKPKK